MSGRQGAGRWNRRALLAEARVGYLKLDWPEPVQAASKGFKGSAGALGFAWRSSLELFALLDVFPGIRYWSTRNVLYVGRSDTGFVAIRLASVWSLRSARVDEVWRTPLGTVVITGREFGKYSLVEFGGQPVWLLTDDLRSLLWRLNPT